ncbi:MAG: AEC family transporter [Firmicutes bacterium]|nr:AEC family transporter [Bacillota bacterium]
MELAKITAGQVTILFILILAGFTSVKAGFIKAEAKKHFSDLLINLIIPAMIINSYMSGFDEKVLSNLLQAFILSTVLVVLGIVITLIAGIGFKDKDAPIIKFACCFSNAAYMGFPLIEALFGDEGLIYASAFVTVYNILLWTVGFTIVSKKAEIKQIIHSIITTPALISVAIGLIIYLCRIDVPHIIKQPISYVGGMNTSLSMIVTGMLIAGSKPKSLVGSKFIPFAIIVRLFVIPFACLALFKALHIKGEVSQIALMLESCPCAAITSVFAVRFDYNEDIAAGAVVITTLLSIITLPCMAYFITM